MKRLLLLSLELRFQNKRTPERPRKRQTTTPFRTTTTESVSAELFEGGVRGEVSLNRKS